MRKFTIVLTVLIAMIIKTNAQIPNSGFENWTTVGSYENPNGWVNCNGNGGTGYPVTKSIDHYPANVGNSSIRMENLTPGSTGCATYGFANSVPYIGYNGASFPITGHPNSFCGYYKFIPQNNDTMTIACGLYLNGVMVAYATLNTTNTVSNWTSFTIPFSSYTTADSASIGLGAFYSLGTMPIVQGNSVLFVDNLSFDNLITSVTEQTSKNKAFSLYPNPASEIVTLNIDNTNNAELTLSIYNVIGTLVKSEKLKQNQQQFNVGDLETGIYMVVIKSKEWTEKQKLIIQR
jgi:hypothetical protein